MISKIAAKSMLSKASCMGNPLLRHNARTFSSECAPATKLRCIFEEYRQEHFSRELPSRFRKEVAKVLEGPDRQVLVDNFNILLTNIGREEARLSEAELVDLLSAAGVMQSSRKISVQQAMQLL